MNAVEGRAWPRAPSKTVHGVGRAVHAVDTTRRGLLRAAGAWPLVALAGCASIPRATNARKLVVVGGGYGGATAARYAALWGGAAVDVTLVERDAAFVSCPLSNLVLGGSKTIRDITLPYATLARDGVRVVHDTAVAIDVERRRVRLARGPELSYDRLVLSPGIDFFFDRVKGLETDETRAAFPHAWQAGPQTVSLRRQLEAMRDGGVFAISIPRAPYRCPPGPYERACQVAWYFKRAKPRSKVLILDGNEDVQSKKALFMRAWAEDYAGIVEYRKDHVLTDVDVRSRTARFETADDVKADVLNVIPPHGAAGIARNAGVITVNDQWCEVDFLTFESTKVPGVHVIGDAIQIAPLMPKSGHMANQHGKVVAAAVVAAFAGQPVNAAPIVNNTCYSYISDREAVHVASVHQYDPKQQTFLTVPGSGGLSPAKSAVEGDYGFAWAQSIWRDMLGA
jgi:NADPH-dependent 2,4-dienoyl-CoA reductase/sulfur reductase-like enzyme